MRATGRERAAMASCPTPEDVLGDSTEPPLALELKCNRCGSADSQRFDYAVVHPKREKCQAEGWDGVLLSRIVECPCGAVDDYVLAPRSHAKLMTAALKRTGLGKQGGGRILVAVSQLQDAIELIARRRRVLRVVSNSSLAIA